MPISRKDWLQVSEHSDQVLLFALRRKVVVVFL
jgi:hypothetical protein